MSRWHASSCSDPRVVIQQQRPRCESCNSSPDIDVLAAVEASKSSPIPYLPPDEPPGQMQLWWPPCVPYVTTGPDGNTVPVQPPHDGVPASSSDEDKRPGDPERFNIYHQRLRKDEFRVMCLYPVEDVNDPIHVSLDVYDDLRYHEYETVSYTWGGENGDSRLNQAVYIGPYWDILFQTRNCWEMLRHMRPWKGVRTIWVDAICINQTDMQERQEQVAKMGRIYEKASRLVIYLGPDLVPPTTTSSPFPRRHRLQELDTLTERPQLPSASPSSSKQWKLSDILRRGYFRRLWIVQELIMSRDITLRIGDTEFILDEAVSAQAVQAYDIPWFTFITRKSIGDQSGNNLRAAVEFVDASRASDPRDKIFGILGLIDSGEHRLAAAYSISFRHLVIGYYAYCLLVKKDIRVIIQASSVRAPDGLPSWVPPAQCDASGDEHLIPTTGNLQLNWLYKSKDFLEDYSYRHHWCGDSKGDVAWVARSRLLTRYSCQKVACEWIEPIPGQLSLDRAAIDSTTGAINLSAVHIMSFGNIDFSKAEIKRKGEVYVHILKAGTSTLNIYANECIIGPADEPDKTHLFALRTNDDEVGGQDKRYRLCYEDVVMSAKSRLCVLQQVKNEAKFRLISASVIACFHVSPKLEELFDPAAYSFFAESGKTNFEYYRLEWHIFSASGDKQTLPLPLVRANCRVRTHCHEHLVCEPEPAIENLFIDIIHPIIKARQSWAGLDGDLEEYDRFFDPWQLYSRYPSPRLAFPTINKGVVFLQFFQSILDAEKSGSSVQFFNTYFQAVREFHPQLVQWKNPRRSAADDSSDAQDRITDLVQLRFEPNQYEILESILDSIQEDVKKSLISSSGGSIGPPEAYPSTLQDYFNSPFLRIGWRPLALNQTNESSETSSANDEDLHGFYALDVINEALDNPKKGYRSDSSGSGDDPSYDSDRLDHDSVLYDDSVIRERRGQTLWVAFDILSLTIWAQLHPHMAKLRRISRFCKAGENEMTTLLRPQTEEDERLTCLNWPLGSLEDFKIDGELRSITII